jgi:hypothetical protein
MFLREHGALQKMNVGPFLAFSAGTGFPQRAQGNVSASILSELAFMG